MRCGKPMTQETFLGQRSSDFAPAGPPVGGPPASPLVPADATLLVQPLLTRRETQGHLPTRYLWDAPEHCPGLRRTISTISRAG